MPKICYWSVGDGNHAYMLQALVRSFRSVGMQEDFIAFSDQKIDGAINYTVENLDKGFFFFKFFYLHNILKNLDYNYFVFLDADSYFVRTPPSLLSFVEASPIHAFLESDCSLGIRRKHWHKCPLPIFMQMMRDCGVSAQKIYTVNGGFFIVSRLAIDLICRLAEDFWKYSFQQGYVFTEEPPLAYAAQMLIENPEQHLLINHPDIWSTDWMGHFENKLPVDEEWVFTDFINGNSYPVKPAIVHAMKSKTALAQEGKH